MKKKARKEDLNKLVTKGELNTSLDRIKKEIINEIINKIIDVLRETSEEKDRKFHVLYEDTNHKITLLSESHQMLIEKIDRRDAKLDAIIGNHERRIITLEAKSE